MIWKKNNDNLSFKKKKYQAFKYILWILQNMNIFRIKNLKNKLIVLEKYYITYLSFILQNWTYLYPFLYLVLY